ncbi:PRA1 family protein H [Beta vulgaris subsp. vulgaris]|uniref:PRA1 family protein H n=1 Tax=Beta vulgaris subsp. vulgaris TaxID=3555 RepID=UPI00203673B9|nr:PRA1 family protein H [Beta vulgaris subsp. vulgaris]
MAFASNPLSLSVPEQAFESWLRDSGYLEVLDHRTTQVHNLNSSAPTSTTTTTPTRTIPLTRRTTTTTITAIAYGLTMSLLSSLTTIFSLLTLNPFAKLTSSDFSHLNSPSWTSSGFLGSYDSYSFPSSSTQAKMRVHENVKRFARNYAALLLVFFACSLYQMPLALVGLVSCLVLWELFRFCDDRWAFHRLSAIREVLIRIAQCAVAVILFWCNVQMAVFCTLGVGYTVMMLHASFRKLTPAKQLSKGRGR